jgi:hypothetical protein
MVILAETLYGSLMLHTSFSLACKFFACMKFVTCMKNAMKTKNLYDIYSINCFYRNCEFEVHQVSLKDSGSQNFSSIGLMV